jgi:hypothetical protein
MAGRLRKREEDYISPKFRICVVKSGSSAQIALGDRLHTVWQVWKYAQGRKVLCAFLNNHRVDEEVRHRRFQTGDRIELIIRSDQAPQLVSHEGTRQIVLSISTVKEGLWEDMEQGRVQITDIESRIPAGYVFVGILRNNALVNNGPTIDLRNGDKVELLVEAWD